MNQEKAREFFSSYYEGSLEPGLKQALEQAMGKDAGIRQDYREFEETYEVLGSLKFETIEIPFDLNDKILANIDLHLHETRRNQQPAWMSWLRNVAIAGVSSVAILGAALSLRNLTGNPQASPVAVGSAKDELTVEPDTNRNVTVTFKPSSTETLFIHEGLKGPERRRATVLEGKDLTTTLENPNDSAMVFDLEVKSDVRSTLIALPGSSPSTAKSGQGTLEDFAKALAGAFKIPVEVHVADPASTLTWQFSGVDGFDAAKRALDANRYVIERRMSNLLVISDR